VSLRVLQPGGWGKPPVDAQGNPLYGDVFGLAQDDDDSDAGEGGGTNCTTAETGRPWFADWHAASKQSSVRLSTQQPGVLQTWLTPVMQPLSTP
jgi:hypothetical protein